MTTGVLALQGAFGLHREMLRILDEPTMEIRTPADLDKADRLVIPGGESSVMAMLAERSGLMAAMRERIQDGMATLGTCAGAIMLSRQVLDGRPNQSSLGVIDIAVRRNAFGRQLDSFTTELEVAGLSVVPHDQSSASLTEGRIPAVFIRAPAIEEVGSSVSVLAQLQGRPVMVQSGSVLATTFHPELSGDKTVHELFLAL